MRMGDFMEFRAEPKRLSSGSRSADTEELGHGAFREQAMAAPPALQALVRVGSTQLAPPSESRRLRDRESRLLFAAGTRPAGMGTILGSAGAGLVAGAIIAGGIGAGLTGLGAMFAALGAIIARNRARAKKVDHGANYPFPVDGYHDWLLSGRPILDVELTAPCNRAFVEERVRGLDWYVSWIDDHLLRIETWPRFVATYDGGISPFWGGNPPVFHAIAARVLLPLHQHVGIVAVRMGGYLDRR